MSRQRSTGIDLPANFWMGVTIEAADIKQRLDTLRELPARIRLVSEDPLLGQLGSIDLTRTIPGRSS